ncbi:unnamed protein product [Ambrosiozyma monospora]|uniref:Unnamed protein product n=1 Tax=Ambrosiozyma monospora TaxID=43982 RepID=A0ACB5TC45_AMBMO|nr:unnamed protein product [Ambrosiozyma monospora]
MLFWRLVFSLGLSSILSVLTVLMLELNNSNFEINEFFRFRKVKLSEQESLNETLRQATEDFDVEEQVPDISDNDQDDELTGRHAPLNTLKELNDVNKRKAAGKRVSLLGIFSGLGAIFAVLFLLRIPVWFGINQSPDTAVRSTYYTVGTISVALSALLYSLLYKDDTKKLFRDDIDDLFDDLDIRGADENDPMVNNNDAAPIFNQKETFLQTLKKGYQLSLENPIILLTYFANLMSRCLTVGMSIFIPIYVNLYFLSSGKCSTVGEDNCPDSYILTSILTGVINLFTLVMAPIVALSQNTIRSCSWVLCCSVLPKLPLFCFPSPC